MSTINRSPAPSDEACDLAWDQIASIAQSHCLIVQAYGGVMTLALPKEQRKAGLRVNVLQMHEMSECEHDWEQYK